MKKIIAYALAVALAGTVVSYAQDSVVGTYKGSFTVHTNVGDREIGVTVVIASVEDGKVKGTATMGGRACAGDYPFEGSVRETSIGLKGMAQGGRATDCAFGFKGTIEGNRLVGNIGKYEIVLRR